MDVYKKIRPASTEKQLVFAGRFFTFVIVVIGILWIPMIRHLSDQIYQYLQAVQAYISPPIAAVFIMGIFWKKASPVAAIVTLVSGGILGASRFILDVLTRSGEFRWGFLNDIAGIAFLNFCIILFLICIFIMILVTLGAGKGAGGQQDSLVLRMSGGKSQNRVWRSVNILVSILVAMTIIGLWAHFS